MNEEKWQNALKLSRFDYETEVVRAKVIPVLDYVARLERYSNDLIKVANKEEYSLNQDNLREDEVGQSLSPSILKKLSKSFMDGYFAVPKVLEEGEA